MATSPASAPVAGPSRVRCRCRNHSRTSQVSVPAAPAIMVVRKALTAMPPSAMPEFSSTTRPPAKSSTPHRLIQPCRSNTQCAIGKYTSVTQTTENTIHGPSRVLRPATEPLIRATVMMAKVSWNSAKA